jgi:hypothetical protein
LEKTTMWQKAKHNKWYSNKSLYPGVMVLLNHRTVRGRDRYTVWLKNTSPRPMRRWEASRTSLEAVETDKAFTLEKAKGVASSLVADPEVLRRLGIELVPGGEELMEADEGEVLYKATIQVKGGEVSLYEGDDIEALADHLGTVLQFGRVARVQLLLPDQLTTDDIYTITRLGAWLRTEDGGLAIFSDKHGEAVAEAWAGHKGLAEAVPWRRLYNMVKTPDGSMVLPEDDHLWVIAAFTGEI